MSKQHKEDSSRVALPYQATPALSHNKKKVQQRNAAVLCENNVPLRCSHLLFPFDEQDVAEAEVHDVNKCCTLAAVHVCRYPEGVYRIRLVLSGLGVEVCEMTWMVFIVFGRQGLG